MDTRTAAAADGGSGDIYADIRAHARCSGAVAKYAHENIILAAIEETLASQRLSRTAVAYMGALLLSLQSASPDGPSVIAGVLVLLDRALAAVPRQLLASKASKITAVLVGTANAHPDAAPVLRPAILCVQRVLVGTGGRGSESARTYRWLLNYALHTHPKVCQMADEAATARLRRVTLPIGAPYRARCVCRADL